MSELAWPRAESAETFKALKSLTLTGPSLPAVAAVTTRRREVAC